MAESHTMELSLLRSEEQRRFELQFLNISYEVQEGKTNLGKTILRNVSGTFGSGRVAAILGPSGAGKSSLLNILSGITKLGVTGTISVDGQLLTDRQYQKLISYTSQEIALWTDLTVEETLRFATNFKTPVGVPVVEKHSKVQHLVEILGLETCRKTLVKNISGGQAKRLSIGIELVSDPKIMLLDEPTSGLDVVSAYQVMSYVRTLAQKGRVIVCVIHQPNSRLTQLIDDMFLMSDGKCAYSGPLADMTDKMRQFGLDCPVSYNPADFALEVVSLNEDDERLQRLILDEEKSSKALHVPAFPERNEKATIHQYALPIMSQFYLLMKLSILCTSRNLYLLKGRAVGAIIIAGLVGVTFYDVGNNASMIITNTSVLLVMMYGVLFLSMTPTFIIYHREAATVIRECKNNWYSLKAYYFAKIVVEFFILIVYITAFMIVIYVTTSQPLELFRALASWLIVFMLGFIYQMIGMILSVLLVFPRGMYAAILISVLSTIFSGFFIRIHESIPLLRLFFYIDFDRYAFEGILNAIYGFDRSDLLCPEDFCYFGRLRDFLAYVGLPVLSYWQDVLGMFVWTIATSVIFYFSLKRQIFKQR